MPSVICCPSPEMASTVRRPTLTPKARLAYILACSHSGSTLLAMLLGAQPGLCTVGELRAAGLGDAARYRCSCGDLILACRFWQSVQEGMHRRGFAFDVTNAGMNIHAIRNAYVQRLLRPLVHGRLLEAFRDAALAVSPAWRRHLAITQARNLALVEVLLEISGSQVVVDSSKNGLRLKYLLKNRNLDVRVIRLIRDGRAVALTVTDEGQFADAADPKLRGGGFGDEEWDRHRPVSFGAHVWRRSNEEAECLLELLDKARWMELRYEQLCLDPAGSVRAVCTFLGLPSERIGVDFRSAGHHVVGNGMRLNSTSEIRLDERWREHLSAGDLQVFNSIAGDLNRKYNYL